MEKVSDVINYVKDRWPDFQISAQHLENPSSDFVVSFYQRFRQTTEELNEKICNGKREIVVPKKNETLFDLMRFINKYMALLTNQGNYSDCKLTITDLYDPTSKRTVLRFKVLLIFLMYYEDNHKELKDVVSKTLQLVEQKKSKKAAVEQLMKGSLEAAEELQNLQTRRNNLNLKYEKANARYKELQKQKEDHDCHINKLKLDLKSLVDTYNNKQSVISNIKANVQRLNEQIVTLDNYESLVNLKENIKKNCEELESTSQALSDAVQCKRPEIEHLESVHIALHRLIKSGEELKTIQQIVSQISQQIQTLRNSINENSEYLKNINEQSFKLKESVNATQEATQMAALKHKTTKNYITQNIQEYSTEMEKQKKDMAKQLVEYEEQIEKWDNLIIKLEESISMLNSVYEERYKKLLEGENKIATSFNQNLNYLKDFLNSVRKS